jgi:hypothetical protein
MPIAVSGGTERNATNRRQPEGSVVNRESHDIKKRLEEIKRKVYRGLRLIERLDVLIDDAYAELLDITDEALDGLSIPKRSDPARWVQLIPLTKGRAAVRIGSHPSVTLTDREQKLLLILLSHQGAATVASERWIPMDEAREMLSKVVGSPVSKCAFSTLLNRLRDALGPNRNMIRTRRSDSALRFVMQTPYTCICKDDRVIYATREEQ